MKREKIAIVTNKMIIGGVEKALINLLKEYNINVHDITIFVTGYGGKLAKEIPDWIKVRKIPEIELSAKENLKLNLKKKLFKKVLLNIVYYYRIKRNTSYSEQCELLSKTLVLNNENYDIGIAYHAPGSLATFYVINSLKCDRKVLYIHGDIEETKTNSKLFQKYFNKYNQIICVSKHSQEVLLKYFPELKKKSAIKIHKLDSEDIIRKSKESNRFDTINRILILTVARLSYEKGIDIAVRVCGQLVKKGYNFIWAICGEGDCKEAILEQISDGNLKEYFVLLGNVENPYSFIRRCQIYVQPSRHEGYCIALAEAKFFNKAIVTTNTTGAKDQIVNNETGYIVEVGDEELLVNSIEKLLNNELKRLEFEENLKKLDKYSTINFAN